MLQIISHYDIYFLLFRTFVNIVPVPFIKTSVIVNGKPLHCQILHNAECSCWIGKLYSQTKNDQERYHRIQMEMHQAERDVADAKEFKNLDEFAAVFQPFPEGLSVSEFYLNSLFFINLAFSNRISLSPIVVCVGWHFL